MAQTATTPLMAPRRSDALVWPLAAATSIYAALLLSGARLLNDPDTFWHIAAGRWIWLHRAVPSVDPFSHTMAGAPWLAHEWLAEVFLWCAYNLLGWTGVVVLSALAMALAFGVLAGTLLRFVPVRLALVTLAVSFLLAASHMVARPHLLAIPLMVIWGAGLVTARAENRAPSLALLPAMALWANLHGAFVIGLGIGAAFAAEAVLQAADWPARWNAAWRWGVFFGGALLASLATPHGIAAWLFPFRLMRLTFAQNFVTEWRSPDFTRFQPIELWLGCLVLLFAVVRPRCSAIRLVLLAGLVYMALTHVRNDELLAFFGPLILAEPVGRALRGAHASMPASARRYAIAGSCALTIAVTIFAAHRGFADDNPKIAPAAALAAADKAQLTGKVFNDYDFGGYLIFTGIKPFVDGRFDLYGDDFMRDYAAALHAEDDALPRLLDRYGVTWTLLSPGTEAVAALDRLPGWERVYADDTAIVHRRIAPPPAGP